MTVGDGPEYGWTAGHVKGVLQPRQSGQLEHCHCRQHLHIGMTLKELVKETKKQVLLVAQVPRQKPRKP